jgi:hypothetical protein
MTHRWSEMDSNYWSRCGETPFERAMWIQRTAPPARRGTDPERDENFESVSLSCESTANLTFGTLDAMSARRGS